MSKPRIISGIYKGHFLDVPDVSRPITDRVKTQLFDLISDFIEGAKIADLYAGSGNLGLEALSRGAKHVTFVENDPEAIDIITSNIEKLNIQDEQVNISNLDVTKFLSQVSQKFDLIFIDPPFKIHETYDFKETSKIVNLDGLIVFKSETNKTSDLNLSNNLEVVYSKKIGKNTLLFLKKKAE